MAAEAIPLINSLLELMSLTAAGSTKGKKYDIPQRYSKKEQKKDAERAAQLMHDDPYSGLSEEEKKKLADEANATVEGFGGGDDNKNDKKPPKPPVIPTTKPRKELQLPDDYKDLDAFGKKNAHIDVAKEGQNRWGKELVIDDSSIMGGPKHPKNNGMSSPEAVQISRNHFMEGQPNSLDTDKAVSELKGQKKTALRNRTVTQDSSDILEHQRAPEDTKMYNKALPDEKLKKALGLGVGGLIGGIANALPLAGADAYELDEDELTDFLKSVNKYINSDDENDKAIGRAMMDSYLDDMGITLDDILARESKSEEPDVDWANIKPEAERLINSDNPEDKKRGHDLIEKYYLGDDIQISEEKPKKEIKKSKGYGLTGMDLY